MSYGICTLAFIPGRASNSDASEQITQLVFGEHYTIIEEQEKWCKIKTAIDDYTCWIDKKQLNEISWDEYETLERNKFPIVTSNQTLVTDHNNTPFHLPIGSILPFFHNNTCKIGGKHFIVTNYKPTKPIWDNLLSLFGKVTYVWGGRTQFGIDCSGFSQMVYRIFGVSIPRDAYLQEEHETAYSINFNEKEEGDLAFFQNKQGKTTHVGIVLQNQKIIHASGYLRIDSLTETGIIDSAGKLTHTFKSIKRYETL